MLFLLGNLLLLIANCIILLVMYMKKRINYIDLLRGFAIFLIVLYHMIGYSKNLDDTLIYLSSFHVSLFFLISGFTYNSKDISFKEYFKHKFKRIMIPFFIFSILFLIPYYLFESMTGMSNETLEITHFIKGIIYGSGVHDLLKQNTPLWFLPCLFITEILAYFIFKLKNKFGNKFYFIIFLFIILGYIDYMFNPFTLPYGINTMFSMMAFFLFGNYLKDSNVLNLNNKKKIILSITLIIFGITTSSFNDKISYMTTSFGNYFIFLLSSFFSCLGYLLLFSLFDIKDKYLLLIGKSTLGILIFHKLFVVLCQRFIPVLNNSNIFLELILGVSLSIVTIINCVIIDSIINKYFPYLYGKSKKLLEVS